MLHINERAVHEMNVAVVSRATKLEAHYRTHYGPIYTLKELTTVRAGRQGIDVKVIYYWHRQITPHQCSTKWAKYRLQTPLGRDCHPFWSPPPHRLIWATVDGVYDEWARCPAGRVNSVHQMLWL